MTFDIVDFIGKTSCNALGEFACAPDQIWNMGAITIFICVVLALGVRLANREQRRRDNYLM
ncbi:MAG: hypothetical protein SGJ03_07290 [Alphaproteobacteria bacterium]|nr:hypothetical protein [Alphaproteobacteria bacterium]